MDLFYTAEWMARQDQDHSLPMQKKLKLKPVEEEGTVFKMFDGDKEKAKIDLHDRNPGEVFKARIPSNGNTFNIIDDSEDSSRIQLRGNGTVLEANCLVILNFIVFLWPYKMFMFLRAHLNRAV